MKPTILTFVAYYLPGYKSGGPVRTIANMVDQLGDFLDFRIVTSDRDSLETQTYPGIEVDSWNTVGKAQVYYAAPGGLGIGNIGRLIRTTPYEILYLNSFFGLNFTVKPLLAKRLGLFASRPVIIAARGEFSKGALELKSLKKKIFIRVARVLGIYRNLIWQASSDQEVTRIRRIMASTVQNIQVAPDLPALLPSTRDDPLLSDNNENRPLRVVFLSRISPMKNLDFALQVLQQVGDEVEFNIYGLVDHQAHWQRCRDLMAKLPDQVSVKYHGVVEHQAIASVLAKHDLFFLPTRGENYGHAIFEALAAGVPVLISDRTPWKDLDQAGVGWVRPLNSTNSFKEVIEQLASTDRVTRMAQRKQARGYAQKVAESTVIRDQNLQLFQNALSFYNRYDFCR